jgi:sRNA-binding carbon storage regulator CsrA
VSPVQPQAPNVGGSNQRDECPFTKAIRCGDGHPMTRTEHTRHGKEAVRKIGCYEARIKGLLASPYAVLPRYSNGKESMLVLTRKVDERIIIRPSAAFAVKLVELLRSRCPDFEDFHFHQLGSALIDLKDNPLFQIETVVARIEFNRRSARIGTKADESWSIHRDDLEPLEKAG